MRSLRKFAYATILSLSVFAIQPTLAAAEDAHGTFTLSHEVHFRNYVLHPGSYAFSTKTMGSNELLMIREINGNHTGAMLMVSDVESSKTNQGSALVLVSRDGKSFVSSMELPEYDMSLRFAVPSEGTSK